MQQTLAKPCNAMPTTLLHSLGGKLDHVFAGGVIDSHNRLQRVPALTHDDKALLAYNKIEHGQWRYTSLSNTDTRRCTLGPLFTPLLLMPAATIQNITPTYHYELTTISLARTSLCCAAHTKCTQHCTSGGMLW